MDALAVPDAPNMTWSIDFMANRLGDGRQFRLLNVLDASTWQGWASSSTFLCQLSGSTEALTGSSNGRAGPAP